MPVYAQGAFVVSPGRAVMVIAFDYLDKGGYYAGLLRRGGEELAEEVEALWSNMQRFLDEEELRINGERVRPVVRDVEIGLRGSPERPFVQYIADFPAPLRPGVNKYEDKYAEEVAEYDYDAVWILPEGARLLRWQIAGSAEAPEPNVLRIRVKRGAKVGGHESFEFEL